MSEKSRERLVWVDQIKGLAISIVVLFHFFQNYHDGTSLLATINKNSAKFGFQAVEIFFVLAGFNISYSWATKGQFNWSEWLKKRILRLYPSYWLAILLTLLISFIFSTIRIQSWSDLGLIILGFPSYSLSKKINPGFWFFSVILQAYLITPLLFSFYKNKIINFFKMSVVLGISSKLLCGYLLLIGQASVSYYLLSQNVIFSYIFSFCLGIYWGFVYKENNQFSRQDWLYAAVIFVIGLVAYIIIFQQEKPLYKFGFDILFTPFCFLVCYWICKKLISKESRATRILAILGFFSYPIYLIHQPILFISLPILVNLLPFFQLANLSISLIIALSLISLYVICFIKIDELVKNKISLILKWKR